jgi:hypothetical protein
MNAAKGSPTGQLSGGPANARAWTWLLAAAAALGTFLRIDQFGAQVLIDDEWHAVHQLLRLTPAQMFLDFGHADYSIPLGLLDGLLANLVGLSESAMRTPMLACGLATLVLFPLYIAPRLGRANAAVFALLLAISPLLVIYSRMARPYAITLLLAWGAHAAFCRFDASPRGEHGAGAACASAATVAAWLHPIIAPFVVAPFLWALFDLRHETRAARRSRCMRLAGMAAATGLPMAALLLPPLLAHTESLAAKAGIDHPGFDALAGVWYAWLGTPSTLAAVLCCALAAYGARDVWRALRIVRTGMLGVVLTLAAVVLTQPAWSHNPLTLARYLLPFAPLLLLASATGAVKAAQYVALPGRAIRNIAAAVVAVVPVLALAASTPLVELARHPNAQSVHLLYHVEFRPERNPFIPYMEKIPLSPFWSTLSRGPRGSLRIAAAPFYFESYDWDAPRWERVSGQTVIPGFLTGLCVESRAGEVPQTRRFRFRNAVHLADSAALAAHHVDYVVWQKPFVQTGRGHPEDIGSDTAHCEAKLRERFGPPAFEDAHLVAFRLPAAAAGSPDAER